MKPRVLVLRAAGSNCDQETAFAFDQAGGSSDLVHINRLLENKRLLSEYQILAIPGGFTYGDDISAGKVYANQLRFHLAEQLQRFYDQNKLIIGICNGFQVLVKAGLLPNMDLQGEQTVTLTNNDAGRYDDRWIYLRVNDSPCVFTREIKKIVHFPMAHAEGKFMPAHDGVMNELRNNRQLVFQYVKSDGSKAEYPWNPNGSTDDIAGICDPSGRVLGLMPHPERNIDATHEPAWTRIGLDRIADGLAIFKNAVGYF